MMVFKSQVVVPCPGEGFIYCTFSDEEIHLTLFTLYWERYCMKTSLEFMMQYPF